MIFWSELAGLDTPRFLLRPLVPADAGDLFAHLSDPDVTQFMDIDPLERQEQAVTIIEWAQDLRGEGHGVRFAIRTREDGQFIGSCGFNSIVVERACRGEIAYDLKRAWWGRGVMAEIMPALIEMGFTRLGLQRLEALVTPGNERSCRLLERHGFALEGRLKDYGFWKDRFWDQLIFARTAG